MIYDAFGIFDVYGKLTAKHDQHVYQEILLLSHSQFITFKITIAL